MRTICVALMLTMLFSCKSNQPVYNDPIPTHDSLKIDSKVLGETRTINIWTPPGYTNSKDSLTVLYMLDGGLKEDFPHIANTIAALIAAKKIQPIMLVGIENTERRRDLTSPTNVEEDKKVAPVVGGSAKFNAFIADELIPEITKTYRTNGKKGIIGESLAGLFVVENFFANTFDYYIAMDPSLWWNNHMLVTSAPELLAKKPDVKRKLWFAASGATDISGYGKDLAKALQTANDANITWHFSDEPKEEHSTIFRATKEKALIWMFGEK